MKLMLEQASKKVKKYLVRYMMGLIVCQEKRTCTNMAKIFKVSHDMIRHFLVLGTAYLFPQIFAELTRFYAKENPGWLIIDDTSLAKEFARWIECLTDIYDTIMRRERCGIAIVVVAWSNGIVTIPIDFRYWYKKIGYHHGP